MDCRLPMFKVHASTFLQIMVLILFAGCQTSRIPNERPAANVAAGRLSGGHIKTGEPYRIGNRMYYPLPTSEGYDQTGIASWYGKDFHGKRTANGERYDMHALSAAHPTLPLPTLVRVTNLENGKRVVVRVNDRGPFVKNRLIDLSYSAAVVLGFASRGTARVRVETLSEKPETFAIAKSPKTNMEARPRMYVQAGAFSVKANAARLKGILQGRFQHVRIETAIRGHRQWYRVRIGPMRDPFEIERTLLSLRENAHIQPIVVTQ